MKHPGKKHGTWFKVTAALIFLLGFWAYQTFWISVNTTEIASAKLHSEVTIVQLSDLHGACFGPKNVLLTKQVLDQKPDLVVVTGDMYTYGDEAGRKCAEEFLCGLAETTDVFFVPGEHDRSESYLETLEQAGVKVLRYYDYQLQVRGNRLHLYGVDNAYYTQTYDLAREFAPPSEEEFGILLAHMQNFDAFCRWGADLVLCGDTHGGAIQLPFIGPVYYDGMWFPQLSYQGKIYDRGLFEKNGYLMYVSAGLGSYPYPIRLFNHPEVSVLKLVPKQ